MAGAGQLDGAQLMAAARQQTGLDDFGDDLFREPLAMLLEALQRQAQLNDLGRYRAQANIEAALATRLRIEDYVRRHPALLERPVERPVFIASLPRTGTTALHHLLNADPSNHTLRLWEGHDPVPPPEDASYDSDPRIDRQRKGVAMTERFMPGFLRTHLLAADAPDECHLLFNRTLLSAEFYSLFNVPDYAHWVYRQDLEPYYRYHRRQLQLLQYRKSGLWVLKSPFHQLGLDAILRVYPDALIVLTHRAPLTIVASGCSFSELLRRSGSDAVDRETVGDQWLEMLSVYSQRFEADRERLEPLYPGQFIDIDYRAFMTDPWPAIEAIYRARGTGLSERGRVAMQGWLDANPPGRHGGHDYRLEDYGITRAEVEAVFSAYVARHQLTWE